LSTKINAVVDENGLPVRLLLTAGQAHDLRAAPQLLAGLKCRHVVADGGYDADALLDLIRAAGSKPHIPSTSQRIVHRSVNRRIYRQRNLVERFFCKLKHFRRVATRFDKLPRNFLAAVALASARLWMRAYLPKAASSMWASLTPAFCSCSRISRAGINFRASQCESPAAPKVPPG
jgi:transposase